MRRLDAPIALNVGCAQPVWAILDHRAIQHHVNSRKVTDTIKEGGIL